MEAGTFYFEYFFVMKRKFVVIRSTLNKCCFRAISKLIMYDKLKLFKKYLLRNLNSNHIISHFPNHIISHFLIHQLDQLEWDKDSYF